LNVAVSKSGYTISGSPKTVTIFYNSGNGGGGNWTAVDVSSIFGTCGSGYTGTINAIAYGNDKFVAGGAGGRMAYSSDN